jgi:uncharacterized membrane protein YcjF (UPF0283 family)
MNCFYHQQTTAVGICKNCNRGLCQGCAAELTNGIACVGRCEESALALSRLQSRSTRSVNTLAWMMLALAVAVAPLALVVMLFAENNETRIILGVPSLAVIGISAGGFFALRVRKNKKEK